MKKLVGGIFIFLFVLFFQLNGQNVHISGKIPSYAGDEITFYTFKDPVSFLERKVANTTVNDSGEFSISFQTSEVIKIFAYLGVFNVYMYVEPGAAYEISLPVKTEKKEEDELNPYFEEFITPVAIVNYEMEGKKKEEELNLLIKIFNDTFLPYYRKHVMMVAANNSPGEDLEKFIDTIDDRFDHIKNPYFTEYMKYKLAMLKYLSARHNKEKYANEYLTEGGVQYNNPAYMELVKEIFSDFFPYVGNLDAGIYEIVNTTKNLDDLKEHVAIFTALKKNTELTELVLLISIYDAYYSGNFDKDGLISILESLNMSSQVDFHKIIAENLLSKLIKLKVDTDAPGFQLHNSDSILVSLEDMKGSYVYLGFCNTKNYTCVNDMEIMQVLYDKHKDKVKFITIAGEDNFSNMVSLFEKNGYQWEVLHFKNQPGILKDYNVFTYPVYYLIGPEGKLLASPAPGPNEGFELKLFQVMKKRGDL